MDLKVVFPQHLELSAHNIEAFVDDYLQLPISQLLEKYSSLHEKVRQ
jgi:hypothetical protein